MSTQLKIPKFQWERLQAALRRSTRDFITDCAEYMGVPAKDLIAKVQAEIIKEPTAVAFFETDEGECEAHLPSVGRFAHRCRKPSLTNTVYCHEHQHLRLNVFSPVTYTNMIKLSLPNPDELPELWLEEPTGRIYTIDLRCIGFYDEKTEAITLFTVEDDLDIGSRDGLSDISPDFSEEV
jgi:hypothetical protein